MQATSTICKHYLARRNAIIVKLFVIMFMLSKISSIAAQVARFKLEVTGN